MRNEATPDCHSAMIGNKIELALNLNVMARMSHEYQGASAQWVTEPRV